VCIAVGVGVGSRRRGFLCESWGEGGCVGVEVRGRERGSERSG
jgi:hypothetical protein